MTVTYLRNTLCIISITAGFTIVSGCTAVAEKPQPVAADVKIEAPVPVAAEESLAPVQPRLSPQDAYIAQLLYQAQDAFDRDRLTTPSYDNAFDFYRQVLELDPANQQAIVGIERITRRYLALASYADKQGQQKQADRYMSVARVVSPNHPLVRQWQKKVQQRRKKILQQQTAELASEPVPPELAESAQKVTIEQLDTLSLPAPDLAATGLLSADVAGDTTVATDTVVPDKAATPDQLVKLELQHRYQLNRRDLAAKNVDIISVLSSIAEHARTQQSRLLIVARNDAEGRWIYQQMRNAVKGFRLRGNIEYDAKPSVVLLDVDSQSD